ESPASSSTSSTRSCSYPPRASTASAAVSSCSTSSTDPCPTDDAVLPFGGSATDRRATENDVFTQPVARQRRSGIRGFAADLQQRPNRRLAARECAFRSLVSVGWKAGVHRLRRRRVLPCLAGREPGR